MALGMALGLTLGVPGTASADPPAALHWVLEPTVGMVLGTALAWTLSAGVADVLPATGRQPSLVDAALVTGAVLGGALGVAWSSRWFTGTPNGPAIVMGALLGGAVLAPVAFTPNDPAVRWSAAVLPALGATLVSAMAPPRGAGTGASATWLPGLGTVAGPTGAAQGVVLTVAIALR